jgi:hypothetical protein
LCHWMTSFRSIRRSPSGAGGRTRHRYAQADLDGLRPVRGAGPPRMSGRPSRKRKGGEAGGRFQARRPPRTGS